MMARRMLRGAPRASSSLPPLRTFVAAHPWHEQFPLRYSSTAPPVSQPSRPSTTIHSTRQPALWRNYTPRNMWSVPVSSGFSSEAVPAADVTTPEDVLHYWFKDADLANYKFPFEFWFFGGEAVDKEIKEKFGDCLERATRGELDNWKSTPRGRVALVLVLDQFSRNCHRDKSRCFAQDEAALKITFDSIQQGVDQQLSNPLERYFLYMPLMHCESLETHAEAHRVFQKLADEHKENPELHKVLQDVVKFENAHRAVLAKFGRYPSRNALLGRKSTPAEEEYLASGKLWPMEE